VIVTGQYDVAPPMLGCVALQGVEQRQLGGAVAVPVIPCTSDK
jgi:hypothetical protein